MLHKKKETFLDKFETRVWNEFLMEVKLLTTNSQYKEFVSLFPAQEVYSVTDKEIILVFLEALIPDIKEIVFERELEVKSDLFKERIIDMKAQYASSDTILEQISQAELNIALGRWHSASMVMNSII